MHSASQGLLGNDNLNLSVFGQVTAVTPTSGSIYGGTLLTIDGINFSSDPLDNPVKVGNEYCDIITTTPSQITCRVSDTVQSAESQVLVLVFAKASEEIICEGTLCDYTFHAPVGVIEDITSSFDSSTSTHVATVTGSGFVEPCELWIDGFEQTMLSFSDTEVKFTISEMESAISDFAEIFFAEGKVDGTSYFTITNTPAFLTVTPATGSAAGTLIHVTGSGFGIETEISLALNGVSMCQTVTMTGYGAFDCLTTAVEITDSDEVTLLYDNTHFDPVDAANTAYTQTAFMFVTEAETLLDEIHFTGAGFLTSGYTAAGSFLGVESTTFTINDDTSVALKWDAAGLPIATSEQPLLWFVSDADGSILYPSNAAAGLTVALAVSGSTSSLSCSFAGGCSFAVQADGLLASLGLEGNSIDVCGNPCIVSDSSTSTEVVCSLPALATTYSTDNYEIT